MATVKKANVAPTHPTVWIGLALAVVGLLVATYAYTGTRVYEIGFAFVALAGGLLALAGILTAAWGRSIMSARQSRARRGLIATDAKKLEEKPEEELPTVAAPKDKKRFAFGKKKEAPLQAESLAGVFAFKRRAPDDPRPPPSEPAPEPIPVVVTEAAPEPAPAPDAKPVRVTLRCPQCSQQFSAEGVRPFAATCGNCGFSATV